jgi:hypothetical protein
MLCRRMCVILIMSMGRRQKTDVIMKSCMFAVRACYNEINESDADRRETW